MTRREFVKMINATIVAVVAGQFRVPKKALTAKMVEFKISDDFYDVDLRAYVVPFDGVWHFGDDTHLSLREGDKIIISKWDVVTSVQVGDHE